MPKFRKKPVVIEAIQWTGENKEELLEFCNSLNTYETKDDTTIIINTLEGDMVLSKDAWLIRGVQGEFYPCKDDIFRATYEPLDD